MNFFLAFGANFISCWIRIRIRNADPDSGDKSNAVPCGAGSGSETLPLTTLFSWDHADYFLIKFLMQDI
jgi:hypothetical protein